MYKKLKKSESRGSKFRGHVLTTLIKLWYIYINNGLRIRFSKDPRFSFTMISSEKHALEWKDHLLIRFYRGCLFFDTIWIMCIFISGNNGWITFSNEKVAQTSSSWSLNEKPSSRFSTDRQRCDKSEWEKQARRKGNATPFCWPERMNPAVRIIAFRGNSVGRSREKWGHVEFIWTIT